MQSGTDVKQYNLTAGKSLPDWLDERKRRTLLKKDVELRKRLELLQDFDMPSVSSNVKISKDKSLTVLSLLRRILKHTLR